MEIKQAPVAGFGIVIRKPVAEVFDAFVNPDLLTKFWLLRSTGPLEAGKTVRWFFTEEISCDVRAIAIEENRRIHIDWGEGSEDKTTAEWLFEPRSENRTYVSVRHEGFTGDGDTVIAQALDSASGFAAVLIAAKAFLEHGVQLNIVADKF